VKIAKDHKRIKELLEVGFEYIYRKKGLMLFKKRR